MSVLKNSIFVFMSLPCDFYTASNVVFIWISKEENSNDLKLLWPKTKEQKCLGGSAG